MVECACCCLVALVTDREVGLFHASKDTQCLTTDLLIGHEINVFSGRKMLVSPDPVIGYSGNSSGGPAPL